MTKHIRSALLACAALASTACVSTYSVDEPNASELERITELAIDTCGSADNVQEVSLDGFVCEDRHSPIP
ncbi:hypothetical protein [uncultured Algimonas sp.]|uniref:hypothetical protein n=1 Tax=uncultured Algimonas sp. TaxID=1547920 RepID=UPI00262EF647|nr:hypothetical protein [uncultured Algimonas sp.]